MSEGNWQYEARSGRLYREGDAYDRLFDLLFIESALALAFAQLTARGLIALHVDGLAALNVERIRQEHAQ